jgi:hypothetical protein
MRIATLGITTALFTASCEDWTEDYDFVWHGERVTVYAYGHTEAEVCRGTFAEIDGHTAMIEEALGLDIEGAPPYVYRWLSDDYWDQIGEENPCYEHPACTSKGIPISRWLPHMHEATHMVTTRIGDDWCPRVLDEGLAMYYDGSWAISEDLPDWGDTTLRDVLEHSLGPPRSVPALGIALHFTSFLAEAYGPKSITALCEELPYEPSMSQWDQAVRRVYGITLEQLIAEYEAYPLCSYSQMRARLWGCSGGIDHVFWSPLGDYVVETGCDDPQVTNARGNALLTRRIRLYEDMKLRVYSNTIGVGPNAVHAIQKCGPCSERPDVFVEITDDPYDYETRMYRRGVHEVTVEFDPSTNVRLSIIAEE